MKKCINCGADMPEEMSYCLHCMSSQTVNEPIIKATSSKRLILVLCAVSAFAIMTATGLLLIKPHNTPKKNGSTSSSSDISDNTAKDSFNNNINTAENSSDKSFVLQDGNNNGASDDADLTGNSTTRQPQSGTSDNINTGNSQKTSGNVATGSSIPASNTTENSDSKTDGKQPPDTSQEKLETTMITDGEFTYLLNSAVQNCGYFGLIPSNIVFSHNGSNTTCSFNENSYNGNVTIIYADDLSSFTVQLDEQPTASHKNSLPALEVSTLSCLSNTARNTQLYDFLVDDEGFAEQSGNVKNKTMSISDYTVKLTVTTTNSYDTVLGITYSYKKYYICAIKS